MSGIGAVFSTPVSTDLGPAAPAPVTVEDATSSGVEATSMPPLYQTLPFQRLSLATMGLQNPMNSDDFAAMLGDLESSIDRVVQQIRDARSRLSASSISIALGKLIEQANAMDAIEARTETYQQQISADQEQLKSAVADQSYWQAASDDLGVQVEGARAAFEAADAAVASLDPLNPSYETAVADRNAKFASLSALSQQKMNADISLGSANALVRSLQSDIAIQQSALDSDTQSYSALLGSFAAIFSALAATSSQADGSVKDFGDDLLRDARLENINALAQGFGARLAELAADAALAHGLGAEADLSNRVKLALTTLVSGFSDVLSGLMDLQSAGQFDPSVSMPGGSRVLIPG